MLASPNEIRRYRQVKLAFAVPLMIATAASGVLAPAKRAPAVKPLVAQPTLSTTADFRQDWPIELVQDKLATKTLHPGTYVLQGRGPKNASAVLYEGDDEIMRVPIDADGHWRAAVKVNEPGVMNFRAEMRRGDIGAGRSQQLSLTFTDDKVAESDELKITNLTPNDRLPAGMINLRGVASPATFVRIYADDVEIGRTEVDLDGKWECDVTINTPGRRKLSIIDEIKRVASGTVAVTVTASIDK